MIWLVALSGCYPAAEYMDDHDQAVCEWKSLCFDEDFATCLDEASAARGDAPDTCEYDPNEARACVDDLDRLECPEVAEELGFPTACDRVWDCG